MNDLVYKNERSLFVIAAILATLVWLAAIIGTVGGILVFLLLLFLTYLFVHAGFIAWIKGNGIEVTSEQFPDLYTRYNECCAKLNIKTPPRLFVLNSDGMLNAFATRFLRKDYVVLFSSIIDALERKPSLVKFYIGHELGHIQRGHMTWGPFLAPVLWLPLLGSAYSRAREYTCDRYGLACTDSPVDACYALTILASGERKWAEVKMTAFLKQVEETGGFWMSFHELTNDYPWLTKRLAHVVALGRGQQAEVPRRNPLAYVFAFFTPRSAVPGAGAIFFFVFFFAIVASIAVPKYFEYMAQTQMAEAEALQAQSDAFTSEIPEESALLVSDPETPASWSTTLTQVEYIKTLYASAVFDENRSLAAVSDLGFTPEDLAANGISDITFSADGSGYDIKFAAVADHGVTPYFLSYIVSSEELTDAEGKVSVQRSLTCYNSNLPQSWWPEQCATEWGAGE